MIFVGRLGPTDKHIFRIVDENNLECIEPARNPSTTLRRVGRVPKSAIAQRVYGKDPSFKTSQL